MSNANAARDWRIYADFAQHLIGMARELMLASFDAASALIGKHQKTACPKLDRRTQSKALQDA